ncbi:uncharacterized protein LOC111595488 [Drosophila hydei]|uniref:Uncharacterized protein LOC111595488 n=1 Tax=Drosophila hydei TaxID=7224 RepID=A0A6J1LN87_DROHY|nr:uncharacterized protein LOC111595488 [Drosophila hydei]
MQIIKGVFLLCCLLMVGDIHVNAAGLDIFKAFDCADIAIDGVGYIAVRSVPLIRELAKCVNFTPDENVDLDPNGFLQIVDDFLKKVTGNPKCMLTSLSTVKNYAEPFVKKFSNRKCLPSI